MDTFHMMVLDMSFEDSAQSAPCAAPTVHLYGVSSDGASRFCCNVEDFLPYFWFPAPSISSGNEKLGEDKMELLKNLLNHHYSKSNNPVVARISLQHRTPLMYYRPGGPFPFLKIEAWKNKLLPSIAKKLSSLVERRELAAEGFTWRDITSYEENIKYGMRFCCDTNIAGGGWIEVENAVAIPQHDQHSRCDKEFRVSWQHIKGLTPDATSDMEVGPEFARTVLSEVHDADSETDEDVLNFTTRPASIDMDFFGLPPLRVMAIHVLPRVDGSTGSESWDIENLCASSSGKTSANSRDSVLLISIIVKRPREPLLKYVFTHGKSRNIHCDPGIEVRVFASETQMLLAWQEFVHTEADPDIICLYQLRDSLKFLEARFKALKLESMDISRLKGRNTQVRSVVTYGKQWVKQQSRMTATSNQEVFRANVDGRIVIDMLRVVLVAYNLSTFTLGECSQVLLKKTKEVLSFITLSALWKDGQTSRVMRYSLQEAKITLELMEILQAVPETIEMARVTGLTMSDVLYKAQMIRVQSLLLRSSHKEGWLLGGPTLGGQLTESPFLYHPREHSTAGFYEDPVCVLDFASLYPSVYMGYNLCYTTLVHPEDVQLFQSEEMFTSPTGAHFVKKHVRHGVLPRICGALLVARKRARDRIMDENTSPEEKAVMDGRQRALKLCSNALYGFTGAGASPQQALALADSCLSLGAESCKRAMSLVNSTFKTGKVIYAQTDSLFVQFRGLSVDQASVLGKEVAERVSNEFPSPMGLKFERVLCPFLLLQVNRYAGKQCTADSNGTLYVRGIESERRDVPFFVRRVCKAVLTNLLVNRDVNAAVSTSKDAIRELVSGKLSMFELLMTGGLWRVDDGDITRLAKSPRSKEPRGTAEEGRGPHVALAVKLKRKNPERQFHIGERIPYVLVARSTKLQDEMAEDPIAALAEDLPMNVTVYLENKLRKPLESILEHFVTPKELREVFSGSHAVVSSTSGSRASVSSFFKKMASCYVCRKPIERNGQAVLCESCGREVGAEQKVAAMLLTRRKEEEKKYSAHAECLRCHSGGLTGRVLCTSTDCPLFYRRHQCPSRLDQVESELENM